MQRFQHRLRVAGACALLALGALAGCGDDDSDTASEERDKIEKGLQLAPVPLDFTGKDRDLVGLGSYIVNAQGGCNDCHTNPPYAPGGDPFQGQPEKVNAERYLKGGMVFPNGIVSPNLRPDESGNPAGLTRDAFIQLIRTGNDEGRLLQIMPWPVYQDMTDRDLRAIHEYLRALPRQ